MCRSDTHQKCAATLCLLLLAAMLLLCAAPVLAKTTVSLSRTQVVLGQSVELRFEDSQEIPRLDTSVLQHDFDVLGTQQSQQISVVNGSLSRVSIVVLTLQPKRSGILTIPSFNFNGQQTQALTLNVDDLPPVQPGVSDVYIETQVDNTTPYVQQAVGVTLRLFYAVPLAVGELNFDAPPGVSLQQAGEDLAYSREVNGREYRVNERRFLLIPERSGDVELPAARFRGEGIFGNVRGFFQGQSQVEELAAVGQAVHLQVQPLPVNAPNPWLPLTDLQVAYQPEPHDLKVGEAGQFTIEIIAHGATKAQLYNLPTLKVDGALLIADSPKYDENFDNGSPVVYVTQSYSLVPGKEGKLTLPSLTFHWWDVGANEAKQALLPGLQLDVMPGTGNFAGGAPPAKSVPVVESSAANTVVPANEQDVEQTEPSGKVWWPWLIVIVIAVLLGGAWVLFRRKHVLSDEPTPTRVLRVQQYQPSQLQHALKEGALAEISEALIGLAPAPVRDLDGVLATLADPAQKQAVKALQRARWAQGNVSQALAQLRVEFASGPQWIQAQNPDVLNDLEPLYPKH